MKKRLKKVWREIKKAYLCNPQTKRGSPKGATVREEASYLSCERAGAREKQDDSSLKRLEVQASKAKKLIPKSRTD